eukprot:6176329-Pleurochrysis_carterae.AAC.1
MMGKSTFWCVGVLLTTPCQSFLTPLTAAATSGREAKAAFACAKPTSLSRRHVALGFAPLVTVLTSSGQLKAARAKDCDTTTYSASTLSSSDCVPPQEKRGEDARVTARAATAEEAARVKAALEKMPEIKPPAGSDLDKMLAGIGNKAVNPLAHGQIQGRSIAVGHWVLLQHDPASLSVPSA